MQKKIVTFSWIISLCLGTKSFASQTGPFFPTHRFPADTSHHISYDFMHVLSRTNFVSSRLTEPLDNGHSLSLYAQKIGIEFQPNRNLSVGAELSFDSLSLGGSTAPGKNAFGDQHVFMEYRFYDEVGASLGAAVVAKFPAYKNATIQEVQDAGSTNFVFLGDAQSDLSALLTGEKWFQPTLRTRFDIGLKLRTDSYSHEIPFLASIGFVTPKVEFDFKFIGNAVLGSSSDGSSIGVLESAFSNSKYALSLNPWVFAIQPSMELWLSTSWALSFDYRYSLMGNNSPSFHMFSFGLIFRSAENRSKVKKTFQQVDIRTDQESGQFQGENQQKTLEPQAVDPTPIEDKNSTGDEEFF